MDSMDFGDIYAFTAIDTFTREADILLAPELTAKYGARFLFQSMRRRFGGHVHLIQTDGGPEFKADFSTNAPLFCHRHRVARPYRKNEQSYIESFNRTVRKECLGWQKYPVSDLKECTDMVESFLKRYHYHRPHLGLGMRPPLMSNNSKEADCRIFTENRAPPCGCCYLKFKSGLFKLEKWTANSVSHLRGGIWNRYTSGSLPSK